MYSSIKYSIEKERIKWKYDIGRIRVKFLLVEIFDRFEWSVIICMILRLYSVVMFKLDFF